MTSEAVFPEVDLACVDAAIRRVPGIGGVTHSAEPSKDRNSPTTHQKTVTQSHSWTYHSKEPASISLTHDGRLWKLSLKVMEWGTPWASAELEALNPTMARVKEAVSRDCDLPIAKNTSVNRD